jgi:hypothetical protein
MDVASNQKASPAASPLMTLVGAAPGANSMTPPEPAKTIAPLPKEALPSSSVPPLIKIPLAMPPAAISSKPPESMVVEIAVPELRTYCTPPLAIVVMLAVPP